MLKTALCFAAIAAVEAKPAPKASTEAPLLTASSTYGFLTSSVLLTKDLVVFAGSAFLSAGVEQLPPNVRAPVLEKLEQAQEAVDSVFDKVESLRLQNGVPPAAELVAVLEKKSKPLVALAESSHLFEKVQSFFKGFETAYPEHAGLVSVSLLDLVVLAVFLGYFVFGYMLKAFCYVFCCGACASRKKPVVLNKGVKAVTDGKKRK